MIALPTPSAETVVTMQDGAPVGLRRYGNPSGPRILFTHGNGLACDLYLPLWSLLTGRFDVLMFDLRNHGWNPLGNLGQHDVPHFVRDLGEVVDTITARYGAKPLIGLFHSLSAVVGLLRQQQSSRFAGLVLFDPPICHLGQGDGYLSRVSQELSDRARQRQSWFPDLDEFAESVRRARVFRLLRPEVPDLFALATLRASGGGFELRCPPDFEAKVYEYFFEWTFDTYQGINCPVQVIGSDPTVPYSFMPAMDFSSLLQVNYDYIPDSTHFLPLEYPAECIGIMLPFLARSGLLESS